MYAMTDQYYLRWWQWQYTRYLYMRRPQYQRLEAKLAKIRALTP